MYKVFLFIAIIAIVGCQNNENVTDDSDPKKELVKNAEAPKPLPSLTIDKYPLSELNDNIVKTPTEVGTANKWTIVGGVRAGDVKKETTLAQLKSSYGANNVKDSNFSQGSKKFLTSKVFEGQPNEFEVFWSDTLSRKDPIMVKITGKGGDWRTNQGATIGSTLEELVTINRTDFYFIGFNYNEYNGIFNGKVRNWNNGAFNNKLGITLIYDEVANAKESFKTFQTLQSFPTNHPQVKDLGLTVKEISCLLK